MLTSASQQSGRIPAGMAQPGSNVQRERDERVAGETRHQEVVEASFDRAEAYGGLGDFEHALEWLDRAAALGGGLPLAYGVKRARWARAASR